MTCLLRLIDRFITSKKENKVKYREQFAKAAVTPKTGRFATLRGFLHVQGSGAPTRGLVAVPLVALCALLALCVGVAQAEGPQLVADGNFHDEGGSGIAVDQSTGDVFTSGFVTDREGSLAVGSSEKFYASGKVLSPPSPFGEGLHYGAAINPTNGRLYTVNVFAHVIEVDDPNTGEELSSFGGPQLISGLSELFINEVQIATDSAGNVYVPSVPENEVVKYSESGTLLQTFTGSGAHALKAPTGVAVDASGDVWVADHGHRVEEFSPSGAFISEFESEGVHALALDRHGDLLAVVVNSADNCGQIGSPCQHLVEYSQSGVQLADVGAGYFGVGAPSFDEDYASMVAVDDASGRVYVSDGLKNVVWVYQSPAVPSIGQESALEVKPFEAKLGAVVRPGGVQATYRFEYDTREYKPGEGPHGVSVPFPEGSAGEDFSARTVWAAAKGLAPGTTYHYRVVVINALESVAGPDQTFTTPLTAEVACPNEAERNGFSAALPDCRAYELVTPPGKSSAQPDTFTERSHDEENTDYYPGGLAKNIAADNGERFAYESAEVMPGALTPELEFIATRGPDGWSTEDALPLRPYSGNRCTFPVSGQTEVRRYSPNLTEEVLSDNGVNTAPSDALGLFAEACRGETVEAVSGEPHEQNLLARDNENGSYRLVDLTPSGTAPAPAEFVAASGSLNVVVFTDYAKLTPEAVTDAKNFYEWREGAVRLLKLQLPSGVPVAGSVVSISEDGSELFFTANGNLYARLGKEPTVQLDEARGGAGAGGGGELVAASGDGTQVFFTDEASAGLTGDTVAGSGKNLYRYDVSTGELSDLTPVGDANAKFVEMSQDGSYLYFSSEGVQSGTQANQLGETARSGQGNLYVDHDGATTFVMSAALMVPPINVGDEHAISQNGTFFAFDATSELTGYENTARHEIYLYSAAAGRFKCASCNPSGEAPTTAEGATLGVAPHEVSDNGQVFFDSEEELLPRDTNGNWNVYEFTYDGGVRLISPGVGAGPSVLLDASVSGDDVFFLTPQSLVPQDNDQEARKIYDARIEGGFPETVSAPPCTTADACRAAVAPQPSVYGEPASQTFSGAGNLAAPNEVAPKTKPKAKPKAKPVKCKGEKTRRGGKKGKCVRQPVKKANESVHVDRRGKR